MVTRRRFLATGSLAAVAASFSPSLFLRLSRHWGGSATPADRITPSAFRGLERTRFVVGSGPRMTRLELVSVSPERVRPVSGMGRLADSSLIFRGSSDSILQQDTYRFQHEAIGSFELFLVPVDQGRGGQQHYQVVFNRILV